MLPRSCAAVLITVLWALPLHTEPDSTRFVISNVDVFDGFTVIRNRSVTIEDGMIRELHPANGPSSGLTLLPGLIDAHVHIGGEESLEQAAALGVTTVLDMWGDPKTLVPLKRSMERGEHPSAADFRTAGIGATVPGGHPTEFGVPMPTLGPRENVQTFVDARLAEGSDYLKIIYEHQLPTLSEAQLQALVAAAHKRGKMAVAHEGVQSEGLAEMKAGVDGVEHIFADTPISPEFIALAKTTQMVFTPTLAVVSAASGKSFGEELAADDRFAPYISKWGLENLRAKFPAKTIEHNHYEYAQGAVRALHAAGLPILAGTDAPNPGTGYGASLHEELLLLTQCGLSPTEALRAATSEPARQFGLVDRGRIEVGRRADLLLVRGDPTTDILKTHDIIKVWKAGVRIDREAIAAKPKKS
jgi:imidazolonepropionase-like amidohydrolase